MVEHDPNGYDYQEDWKEYGYPSFEAYIEAKAGASPPEVDTGFTVYDVPVNPADPNCSSFRGRRVMRSDWPLREPVWPPEDEALDVPDE